VNDHDWLVEMEDMKKMTLFFSAFFKVCVPKYLIIMIEQFKKNVKTQLLMDTTEVFSSYVLLIRIMFNNTMQYLTIIVYVN